MLRRFRIILPLLLGAILLGWGGYSLAVRNASLPETLFQPPPATPVVLDFRDRAIAMPGDGMMRDSRPLPLRDMGDWLPRMTVAIEDHRFWNHQGVDGIATCGAFFRNFRNLRIVSGASTISQQTIKLATGRSRRTLDAKIREAVAAQKLETVWSKNQILEAYLNRLDYGNRRIGPEAAAQAYFGKSARDVSIAEAIYLAGLPQSPSRLNPWRNPDQALLRYQRNVRRLADSGLLPEGITAESLLAAIPKTIVNHPVILAPHFSQVAVERRRRGETTIRTTMDLDLQHVAETLLHEHLRTYAPFGIGDAAIIVVENSTGDVRALASGGRADHRAINAATTARSCGSTLKPFIYLQAIERRLLTAASLLPDTEQAISAEYQDYDPQNYSHRFYGPVRVREALGNSLNVPAVVTVSRLGARDAFNNLRNWGFHFAGTFDDYGAGFILGNADITLLDLAGAYAGLARGGLAWQARVLRSEAIESRQLVSSEACAIITDILCDNNARRLSFGLSSPLDLGSRVAVKTGTSSGFRDRWCVGFNKKHTVAVWAGNLDGKSLGELLAVRAAAPLWAGMMKYLMEHGDGALPEPIKSDALVQTQVDAITGLLPDGSENVTAEYFLSGTEPTASSTSMYRKVGGNVKLLLPAEYGLWCTSSQNRLDAVAESSELQITYPRDGADFILNPHLPKSQQTVNFAATQQGCRWLVNGREVNGSFPLQRGEWVITAEKNGALAESRFKVE